MQSLYTFTDTLPARAITDTALIDGTAALVLNSRRAKRLQSHFFALS